MNNRAPLSSVMQELRPKLAQLAKTLEAEEHWYGSVYLERKQALNISCELKESRNRESVTMGAVLRIYDGYCLYEQATDRLDALDEAAAKLIERVRKENHDHDLLPYKPPSWAERLKRTLDDNITSQIPKNVSAETEVHFGIRFEKDPKKLSIKDYVKRVEDLRQTSLEEAKKLGMGPTDLTFMRAMETIGTDESIFVDRETNVSQTIYRLKLMAFYMSGADRVYTAVGGLGGLECLDLPREEVKTVLKELQFLKSADRLEPGKYRVLFSPEVTGVLAHEAFGHSQEGDTCVRGRSKAWDLHLSGESVGNEHATILNNPAIFETAGKAYGAWGSYFFDEEGWLAEEQVLLDKGKLCAPMTNLTAAIRLDIPRTANGKRENWSSGVYTRQTNTYFSPGTQTYEELISQIEYGFLAKDCAGGMEDPKGMGIQVGISYLKEIRDGKLTGKIFKGPAGGDVQMTGYTPDVLNSILGKSKINAHHEGPDAAIHPYIDVGGCGKYHKEFVQAGCGGPYVLMDEVILG